MTVAPASGFSIAQVDRAALPAAVRDGSAERRDRYEAALGFERQLIGQLTEQLMGSIGGEQPSAALGAVRDSLPSTLADAILAQGGLGIAAQLDTSWNADAVHTSVGDAAADADTIDGDAGTGAGAGGVAA